MLAHIVASTPDTVLMPWGWGQAPLGIGLACLHHGCLRLDMVNSCRAMAEFRASIGELTCPDISREEIVNACGVDDFHDGVNYTRTACVIAVSKARDIFEPFLHQVSPLRALSAPGAPPPGRRISAALEPAPTMAVQSWHPKTTWMVSDADTSWDLLGSPLESPSQTSQSM